MHLMLIGGIATFFLRFWHRSRDRFFLLFAASFFVEGVNRIAQGLSSDPNEFTPLFSIVRFISFCLIIIAILHKNLRRDQTRKSR